MDEPSGVECVCPSRAFPMGGFSVSSTGHTCKKKTSTKSRGDLSGPWYFLRGAINHRSPANPRPPAEVPRKKRRRAREMDRADRKKHLSRTLHFHAQNILETFQVFDQPAAPSLEKVDWSEVTKLGDEISKQATITGMLWTGKMPDASELEENIGTYCNVLQGFLLLCHGSTVGAGPTLQTFIRSSTKQIIDCSLSLLKDAVSSYGSRGSDKNTTIPRLSGLVWEACAALKKTPTTNCTAIGRAMTQVAVSVKDVLREMRELKVAAIDAGDETSSKTSNACESDEEVDSTSEGALGSDLSPEEMNIANLAIVVISDTLMIIKEAIRFISGLIKKPMNGAITENEFHPLERLLKYYQEIGVQVDELGACVYPPQEVPLIRTIAEKMRHFANEIQSEVQNMEGSSEDLIKSLEAFKSSLGKLQSGLLYPDTAGLVQDMTDLAL